MRFKEFQEVALAKDIPENKLRRGDLATIVDIHPANGGEAGYSIEVFNRSFQRAWRDNSSYDCSRVEYSRSSLPTKFSTCVH